MTIEALKRNEILYVEHVLQGMDDFPYEIRTMCADRVIAEVKERKQSFEEQGLDVYVDFYYCRLTEGEKQHVRLLLSQEEQDYLDRLEKRTKEEEIIFVPDDMLLTLIAKLNEKEALFSTIYFPASQSGKAQTWWGNYGGQYLIFSDR